MHPLETELTITAGEKEVSAVYARPDSPAATIVVAHGAGAGMDHPFMTGFTRAMNNAGAATLRFNFPYIEAGKKFPDRPPMAIATWLAAMEAATAWSDGEPVWAAGKSFGGRMASMAVAEGMDAAGLVFLGYPLHPPGKPEKTRDEHLYGLSLPMLFLQGSRDTFATTEGLEAVVSGIGSNATLHWWEGGDHSFNVKGAKRPAEDVAAGLAEPVMAFLRQNTLQS